MNALILAAGTGSRLVHMTRNLPKALVEVLNRPLIKYTLEFVEGLGCKEIIVTGGFYFEKLREYLGHCKINVKLVENKEFLKGSILSLNAAWSHLDDSFLLLNVDHIYPRKLAKTFLEHKQRLTHISAFADFDRPLREDDMKILLGNKNKMAKISKSLHVFDAGYIGITYIPPQKIDLYKKAALQVAKENDEAAVETILQRMVNNGDPPEILDGSGIRWLEVDNQSDLQNAERILRWVKDYLD
jgi:choline kinase